MNMIRTAIEKFNKTMGVTGALVCTYDGILIEGQISERFDRDMLSALASSVGLALKNACKEMAFSSYSQYHITASRGDMVISDLGSSLFVVILEKGIDIGSVNAEMFQTANQIKKIVSMD